MTFPRRRQRVREGPRARARARAFCNVPALPFPTPPPPSPGLFLTKIFHPNVSASGEICVNTLKKDWKPEHTLAHVLQVVHCLLVVPFPESSLNDEAGKLFMESYDEYARKARLMTDIHAGGGGGSGGGGGGGAGAGAAPGAGAALAASTGNVDLAAAGAAGAGASGMEKRKAAAEGDAKKKSLKRL
jgi:ubiquitin-conjugating enzyme E2 S